MFQKMSKKISVFLICSMVILFNTLPTYANTTVDSKVLESVAASNTTLTDGSSCTQYVSGGMAIFDITVADIDARSFFISSSVPVKSIIVPVDSALNVKFDSGDFRMYNSIGLHFMPYVHYRLMVTPENPTTAVGITVSMSKGNSLNWVKNGRTIVESNMLFGGQMETYGLAFESSGLYSVTFTAASQVSAMYIDQYNSANSKVEMLNNPYVNNNQSSCTFYVNVTAATDHSHYGVAVNSNDAQGQGGLYTITVQKLN